jgi:hypothetical protein
MLDLIVKDRFVSDADALRNDVLSKGFETVVNPGDGLEYTGVQVRNPLEFQDALAKLVGFPVRVRVNAARLHYKGEGGRNAIHADHSMGEFAAVIYLNPDGAPVTGTAFWSDKLTGWEEMPTTVYLAENGLEESAVVARIAGQAGDPSKWVNSGFIASRPGRIIVYPTKRFHSRYPFLAFGDSPATARLVITLFFDLAQ